MRRYVSKCGDTLAHIGRQLDVDVAQLCRLNPLLTPDKLVEAGQIIIVPEPLPEPVHTLLSQSLFQSGYCEDALLPVKDTFSEWIPLTPLSQMEQTEYDVLIIGSGAGGSAVLRRLCERKGSQRLKIGMIERGKLLLPTHALNVPSLWSWERMQRYYQNPTVSVPAGKRWPEFPGALLVFALGGRTLFWGATSVRIPAFEFMNWPISYLELEPYYKIAEIMLHVSTVESPINDLLLERLWLSGYAGASNVPEAVARGRIPHILSALEFIGDALRTGAFDLAVQTQAVQVLTKNGSVTGVRAMDVNNRSYVLKASTVIVAGSTFETPRLLLNSGIPGKAIGHYLANHSYIKAEISGEVPGGGEGAINILLPQTERSPYQFKILGNRSRVSYDVSGKIESRFDNFVYLDEHKRDSSGTPELQVRFSHSQADKEVMHRMVLALGEVSEAMRINKPLHYCFWPLGFDNHDFGTCRMGNDPLTSATDLNGRIHSTRGLYIADASVIPVLGAVNPLLTIVALATRLADHLLEHVLS